MKFFAIHISDLESESFTAASNDQIANWIFLHGLCAKQQNSGTIQGAASIPDRFWSRHCIEKRIIAEPSPLWTWNGQNLSIHPYDIDGQTLYLKKSEGGKSGAEKRWKGTENGSPNRSPICILDKSTQQESTQDTPLTPKGELEDVESELELETEPIEKPKTILPKGWEKMNPTTRKQTRVNLNSPTMNRIGKMLGRREGTLWTVAEAVALKTVNPQADEIELMETYYLVEIPKGEDYRRRDLITLLNNWNGELDRARTNQLQ